jgi:hypothetical protein
MDVDDLFAALLGALFAGLILFQLISGKLVGSHWRVVYTRREKPLVYWPMLAAQTAIVAVYFLQTYT